MNNEENMIPEKDDAEATNEKGRKKRFMIALIAAGVLVAVIICREHFGCGHHTGRQRNF